MMSDEEFNIPISIDDCDDDGGVYVDIDKTLDYISGRMTFEEYSNILEQGIKQEPCDEGDESITAIETITPAASAPAGSGTYPHRGAAAALSRRRPRVLPRHLQGLIGEANSKYARGAFDEAERMCLEVIRSAPNNALPFRTLADIHEERGDMNKSIQFRLIAAHLAKNDPEEWASVGGLYASELDNISQAAMCLEKAARLDPHSLHRWDELASLLSRLNDERRLLECRQQKLTHTPINDPRAYMQLTRDLVKAWHGLGDKDRTLAVMSAAFDIHPDSVEVEDINVLLELHIGMSVYDRPLVVLVRHCGVCLIYPSPLPTYDCAAVLLGVPLPDLNPARCDAPDSLPVDLRTKLVVCLIHRRYVDCVDGILAPMLRAENPELVGDLYLDVVDAYMSGGHYAAARPILALLVATTTYNMAAVWLRYAECLNALQELGEAAGAFGRVVEMAPGHYQARLSLSALQQQLGRAEEALKALQMPLGALVQDDCSGASAAECGGEADVRLLVARCSLLHAQGHTRDFADCAKLVLYSFCREVVDNERLRGSIVDYRRMRNRLRALRYAITHQLADKLRRAAGTLPSRASIPPDDLWALFVRLCAALVQLRAHDELEVVAVLALICPQFMASPEKSVEADFICLQACIMNRNANFAYGFVRELCIRHMTSARAWNTFGQIVTMSQDLRHNRFCIRLAMKYPDSLALGVLNGNNAMVAGSYKHALGEYVAALRHDPSNPLVTLLIALCFVHMGSQKFVQKHHSLAVQACAFLDRYAALRGDTQESCYNLGRAHHQLGLTHLAVEYYRRGLGLPPAILGDEQFDLTRELAFNLSLVYKGSKSYELARQVTQQYLIV